MKTEFPVNNQSPPHEKIALFRSFFRGREDVFPRRFENKKTGKAGYIFVCGNEWVRGICEKPKIKCSDCRYRRPIPINDVKGHVKGQACKTAKFNQLPQQVSVLTLCKGSGLQNCKIQSASTTS